MIKIEKILIKRFRSILNLKLEIDKSNNFITVCGENNTGKTNVLRALNLFFKPFIFNAREDAPHHKFYGTWGGAVFPEITVEFYDDKTNIKYIITRSFDYPKEYKTIGEKIVDQIKSTLIEKEINIFLKKIEFFFVESINVSFPQIIESLTENIYDVEYSQSRFTGIKKKLKNSYEEYVSGLSEILNGLSNEINPMFKKYKENWGVSFNIEPNIIKFRDIISDDVEFYINDNSNKRIDSKGSGLQRLAYILLHFRIIDRIRNKKSVILLIDEPDVYLHEAIERKLLVDLKEISTKSQLFITTHSKIFIDTYNLKNVFLLSLNITDKFFKRKNKVIKVLETVNVELSDNDGAKKIKEYLGIEDEEYEILQNINVIVEGETDKYYIEELQKYFGIEVPNIVSANGADNIIKYLEFYDSYYKDRENIKTPFIRILLDNDQKGREVFQKINKKTFLSLEVTIDFVPNFMGESILDKNNFKNVYTDHQIEDLIYPDLFCYLFNIILEKKKMEKLKIIDVVSNIKKPAHKDKGILFLIENMKNFANPENGHNINLTSSNSEQIKNGIAKLLKIEGDIKIAKLIEELDKKYPSVKEFLKVISKK